MNINNLISEDWKFLAAELIWFNVVSHKNEYSGYDIVQNPSKNSFWEKIENQYPRGDKPGDIVRDVTFLSYGIGPTRRLSWKELALALGLYKDILLPDYHDCSKCEDYKNCRAYFKDDTDQERCSGWENDHKDEVPDLEEEYKKFMDDLLNNPSTLDLGPHWEKYFRQMLEESELKEINNDEKELDNPLELVKNVYKKTIAYDLDSISVNEDGTTVHRHSDRFLDEHPERKDTPNFTEEEETELYNFIAKMAQNF